MRLRYWTDSDGHDWPVVTSKFALSFRVPAHAALRREVFKRADYKCSECHERAEPIPADYNGRYGLTMPDSRGLWLVHTKPKERGGKSVLSNLKATCEACSGQKQSHETAILRKYKITPAEREELRRMARKLAEEHARLKAKYDCA